METAVYIRSSPKGSRETAESVAQQREAIARAYPGARYYVDENVKGDDPNRPALYRLLKDYEKYRFKRLVVWHPDRLARGWLGLKWLHEEFIPRGIQLVPLNACPPPTTEDGTIDQSGYIYFGILCLLGYMDLVNIRRNTARGREKALRAGVRFGRPRKQVRARAALLLRRGVPPSEVAKRFNIKEATVRKWLNGLN